MSDESIPEARAASDEPAAIRAPAEQPGPRPADDGEAPRKRRRRGSRGGRNRRRPAAANANGGAAGVAEDNGVDLGIDRPLAADDLPAGARTDAGLDGEPAPRSSASRRSRPAASGEPAPEAEGDEEAPARRPPAAQPGRRSAPRPAATTGSTSSTRRGRGTATPAEGTAEEQAGEELGTATPAPSRRRRRRGGRRRNAPAPVESPTVASLDDLDESVLQRRRGGTRKGRPTGRYMMAVHVQPGVGIQVAVLEGRSLVEHYVSRPADSTTAIDGNIYLGKVQNVLPGMEAAFVDIGTPKNGVLYRDDIVFDETEIEGRRPKIERLLRNGQSVVVQVTKNPIGTKGARLTQEVSLAGRFVVMIPGQPGTYGISKRLSDDERKRLRKILDEIRPSDSGLIVRTAAEGASADELHRDMRRLMAQWDEISKRAAKSRPPVLLHQEPDLAIRVIREEFNKEYRGVVIDDPALYEEVLRYVEAITPELADRVELYDEDLPIFERYHVHEQLHKALDRKVWLPSGGSIIIERTEALTVIDVNTAKNVGRSNLEETVFNNNLEAADEVARQLRLRDIGGIIVIDFIDMEIRKNREEVVRKFKEALARDKTRTQVFEISELGLVEMTRKRISEGLVE
ncbi:MAG TPA: Rne/Rng family ribonuclease, partial [Acidimicrobiia bacterium]